MPLVAHNSIIGNYGHYRYNDVSDNVGSLGHNANEARPENLQPPFNDIMAGNL